MANMKTKKNNLVLTCIDFAAKASSLTRDISELINNWTDNGFAAGGANPIVQADLDGTPGGHLTPALLATFIADIANVNLNAAQRSTMRKVATSTVLPTVK